MMSQGFYEMLGVARAASADAIRQAFQARLAALVRRLKAARKQGADVSLLESQERALREGMEILADPARRRRYDAFRDILDGDTPPTDASELWEQCRGSLMDPATVAALNVVRALTELPVGEPIAGLPPRQQLRDTPSPRPSTSVPAPAMLAQPPDRSAASALISPPPLQMAPPSIAIPLINQPAPTATVPSPAAALRVRVELPPLPEPEEEEADDVESLARRYGYDGRFLRAVRESQGLSLDTLSRATRISLRYLEALEANAFDRLPSKVFVRGYVREVARELDIDETDVVEQYVSLYEHHGG
ncbi:MAG: hypothetical protein ACI8S6_002972 [Myxococcota bacterium]|jgi:hypothetical protein